MRYRVFCINSEGPHIDSYEETAKVGDYLFNYSNNTLKVYSQTGSSDYGFVDEIDNNYIKLFTESDTYQKWEGKDHFANEVLYIDIDYPKKEYSSDSTDEQASEELTKVHAHINSLKPDHVVVGDDDSNEIYSLNDTIGNEYTPVYIKQGIITAAKEFRKSVRKIVVNQNKSTATVQLYNPDSSTTDFSIASATLSRAGLMTPAHIEYVNSLGEKLNSFNRSVNTKITTLSNSIDDKLAVLPTKDQVSIWARTAAENALIDGFAAKWSAIARQIQLDDNGNIVTINGAGFLADDSFSEMFAGYMDAKGKQKFASIVADVYKDELKGITTRITAAADKIYMRAYKEAALGVFNENTDALISGISANEKFVELIYKNIESGVSGGITIEEVKDCIGNYKAGDTSRSLSQILLDANKIATSNNTEILELLSKKYSNGELDLSGFVSYPDYAGMFVASGTYNTDKEALQNQINGISGIFTKNDENGKSVIYLDADDVRLKAGATISTYLGALAKYENGKVILNPVQLQTTQSINAILSNKVQINGETKTLAQHLENIKTAVSTQPDGTSQVTTTINANNVIIGAGADADDLEETGKLSDVLTISNGEITCKAATFTENQKTLFKDASADLDNLDDNDEMDAECYTVYHKNVDFGTGTDINSFQFNSTVRNVSAPANIDKASNLQIEDYLSDERKLYWENSLFWKLKAANTKIIYKDNLVSNIILPCDSSWIGTKVVLSHFNPFNSNTLPFSMIAREDGESIWGTIQGTYSASYILRFSQGIVELLCVPSSREGVKCEWFVVNQRCVFYDFSKDGIKVKKGNTPIPNRILNTSVGSEEMESFFKSILN